MRRGKTRTLGRILEGQMLKSMMRANAVAAALFLGYAAYTFTNAPGERFLELPLDRFTIQSIQKETNIEVLRKHVLYLMEQNERRRKDDNDFRVAYRRIHTETLAALALF